VGAGTLLFPVVLVLINLRSRTHAGSVALSGFAQGVGYAVGALGPIVVGLLHDATSGWIVPLVFLLATAAAGIFSGVVLAKPRFVEDDIARHD
jgi:CP family cyanate transporter-like MFS transporter